METIYKNTNRSKVTLLLNKNHWVEKICENNKELLSYQIIQSQTSYYKPKERLTQGKREKETRFTDAHAQNVAARTICWFADPREEQYLYVSAESCEGSGGGERPIPDGPAGSGELGARPSWGPGPRQRLLGVVHTSCNMSRAEGGAQQRDWLRWHVE